MTKDERTWSVLALATVILLLVLWLWKKRDMALIPKPPTTTTQTSVTLSGTTTQFGSRNDQNQILLRICTYDSGAQLTLDPGAVGGHCPPVYADITGKAGNLLTDEVITIPNAGQNVYS
jgi:hypothetical protein